VCLLLALFGRAAVSLLSLIPLAVLAVFLVYVGIQHAAYLGDILKRPSLLLIALAVGLVSLLTTNLMWGFLTGFALEGILWTSAWARERRARRDPLPPDRA
jgi:MFS superfamily sulfate permease-like transporter